MVKSVMKTCKKCGSSEPVVTFRLNANGKPRLDCRECERKAQAARYAANPEKYCAATKKWCKDHPAEHAATRKKHRHSHKAQEKAARVLRDYKLTPEAERDIYTRQQGLCPLCLRVLDVRPCIDHDHITDAVRGILCTPCNSFLGRIGDTKEAVNAFMARGLAYLK